jgi:hypothetical protein
MLECEAKLNKQTKMKISVVNMAPDLINVTPFQVGFKDNCSVSIHILDVNDNEPKFEKLNFTGYISETASVGSLVLLEKNFSPLVTVL